MAFSARYPKAVGGLNTEGLLELIRSPQKAAEYWEQYKTFRKEYEDSVAALEAFNKEATDREKALVDKATELAASYAEFHKSVALHEQRKTQELLFLKDRAAVLDVREAEVAAKETAVAGRLDAAAKQEKAVQTLKEHNKVLWEQSIAGLQELEDELKKREVAVAEREAKADALAKLLKSV